MWTQIVWSCLLIGAEHTVPRTSGDGLCLFVFEFADELAVFQAGHLGHPVEDEDAVEVVGFVLPDACEKARGALVEGVAVEVACGDGDLGWADDLAADFGEGEAAFGEGLAVGGVGGEGGVDVDLGLEGC